MWKHVQSAARGSMEVAIAFTVVFPRALVFLLLLWSLWAGLTRVIPTLNGKFGLITATAAMILYLLSLASYFAVIWIGPGSPLDYGELWLPVLENPYVDSATNSGDGNSLDPESEFQRSESRIQQSATAAPVSPSGPGIYTSHTFKNYTPAYRLCRICRVWKPDRCHHCSSCNRCFLRMDHHCPWFACCIGFRNQKLFVQCLAYISTYCTLWTIASGFSLWRFFNEEQYDAGSYLLLNAVFVLVLGFTFALAVGVFFCFQVYLVVRNTTTIELQDRRWGYSDPRDGFYEYDSSGSRRLLPHIYDIGVSANWRSVMGPSWYHWLLPTSVTSLSLSARGNNGIHFAVDQVVFDKMALNAKLQEQLSRQLAQYRDSIVR